jgi:hypothetical protein
VSAQAQQLCQPMERKRTRIKPRKKGEKKRKRAKKENKKEIVEKKFRRTKINSDALRKNAHALQWVKVFFQ